MKLKPIISATLIDEILIFLVSLTICLQAGSQHVIMYNDFIKTIYMFSIISLLFFNEKIYYGKYTFVILMLIITFFISNFLNFESANKVSMIKYPVAFLILSSLSLGKINKIMNFYASIVYYLVIISIVFFIIQMFNFDIMKLFPLIDLRETTSDSIDYKVFYNAYIYTSSSSPIDFRNRSIFWEPGVFQYHMTIAFFWFSFVSKRLTVNKYIIFTLGYITCLSTSGLICYGLIFIMLIRITEYRQKLLYAFLISVAVILLLTLFYQDYLEILFDFSIGKFSPDGKFYGSYHDRLQSSLEAYNIFLANIFFGLGNFYGTDKFIFVTSGIFQLFMQFGIFFGIPYMMLWMLFFQKQYFFIGGALALVLANSEALIMMDISLLLIIYTLKTFRIKKHLCNEIFGVKPSILQRS